MRFRRVCRRVIIRAKACDRATVLNGLTRLGLVPRGLLIDAEFHEVCLLTLETCYRHESRYFKSSMRSFSVMCYTLDRLVEAGVKHLPDRGAVCLRIWFVQECSMKDRLSASPAAERRTSQQQVSGDFEVSRNSCSGLQRSRHSDPQVLKR